MKLREWRILMGYPQQWVADKLKKKHRSIISLWEKRGIKNNANRMAVKKMSKSKINDFRGCNEE